MAKPEPSSPPTVVRSLEDLLRALDLESRAQLEDTVYDQTELDGWIDWEGTSDEELVVCVNSRGFGLVYPFPLSEFWETLEELDQIAEDLLEALLDDDDDC